MLARGRVLLLFFLAFQLRLTRQESWWISDSEFAYEDSDGAISVYNAVTHNTTKDDIFQSLANSSLSCSRNLNYTAEQTYKSDAHRDPSKIIFSMRIHETSKNISYPVGLSSQDEANLTAFKWSHGSAYAFEIDDGIYYTPSPGELPIKIKDQLQSRISDGSEIKEKKNVGISFSPSDKYLAFTSISNNLAKQVQMTSYIKGETYDYHYDHEYMMTGEKEHFDYSILIWSVEERKSAKIEYQIRENSSFYYPYSNSWVVLHGSEFLLVPWVNRWLNETTFTLCSYENATCSPLYKHTYEHSQWVDYEDHQNIVYSNSAIFVILPRARGDNAWQHIAKIEISSDYELDSLSFLPAGDYDIRRIIAYRPIEDVIMYDAQAPNPWNRHVYAAPVTVPVSHTRHCYHMIEHFISKNYTFSEPSAYYAKLPEQPIWKTEMFNLSSGYEAIVRIYEGDTNLSSVPVTLFVYGGPNFNVVTDEFKYGTESTFTKRSKDALVFIDVRGSGGRGWKYRSAIYGRLVTVEVEDTIEAMKMVLEKYPRLDNNRVGVYGGSYGGTMTIALVESAPKAFFKCALAVAPVTNFLSYRAAYSESYMGDAPRSSYTDLTRNVTAFRHTKFMLVHGMRDGKIKCKLIFD